MPRSGRSLRRGGNSTTETPGKFMNKASNPSKQRSLLDRDNGVYKPVYLAEMFSPLITRQQTFTLQIQTCRRCEADASKCTSSTKQFWRYGARPANGAGSETRQKLFIQASKVKKAIPIDQRNQTHNKARSGYGISTVRMPTGRGDVDVRYCFFSRHKTALSTPPHEGPPMTDE